MVTDDIVWTIFELHVMVFAIGLLHGLVLSIIIYGFSLLRSRRNTGGK